MRLTTNIGMLALGAYLILVGVAGLGVLPIAGLATLTAILAVIAGILIIIGR